MLPLKPRRLQAALERGEEAGEGCLHCFLFKDELGNKTGLAEGRDFGATPKGQTHRLSRAGRCWPSRSGGRPCILKAPGTSQRGDRPPVAAWRAPPA